MIPILEAETSIRRAEAIAVGTGAIKNAREKFEEWHGVVRVEAAASASAPLRKPALFSDEALARLPVRRVVKREKG